MGYFIFLNKKQKKKSGVLNREVYQNMYDFHIARPQKEYAGVGMHPSF